MATGTKICKICGKEYPACLTEINGVFRWKDVACCPEHAAQYFAEVRAARSGNAIEPEAEAKAKIEVQEADVDEKHEDVSEAKAEDDARKARESRRFARRFLSDEE